MSCHGVLHRLSAYRDGDLPASENRAVAAHLASCEPCASHWRSLEDALEMLAELPRVSAPEPLAARVKDRLEVESRGPGLALLFRPFWAARPLIFPSLVPAVLVLVAVVTGALILDRDPHELPSVYVRATGDAVEWRIPPSGTEANPLFLFADVVSPRAQSPLSERLLEEMEEGTLFLETVVARDGSVSTVTLLEGDTLHAARLMEALRQERFEPGRFRGRPVAVSMYRLISRMDVRASPLDVRTPVT